MAVSTILTGLIIFVSLFSSPDQMMQPRALVLSLTAMIMALAIDITTAISKVSKS